MSLRDSLGGLFAKAYTQIQAVEAKERRDAGAILLDVSNLRGAMRDWAGGGLPVVAKGSRPGSVI